jgi:hypothetical protein
MRLHHVKQYFLAERVSRLFADSAQVDRAAIAQSSLIPFVSPNKYAFLQVVNHYVKRRVERRRKFTKETCLRTIPPNLDFSLDEASVVIFFSRAALLFS